MARARDNIQVTPEIQALHFKKYNLWWSLNSTRVKRSVRSRLRWGEDMWHKNVDQCALAMFVVKEARQDARVSEEMIENMLRSFLNGFFASIIKF